MKDEVQNTVPERDLAQTFSAIDDGLRDLSIRLALLPDTLALTILALMRERRVRP